MFERVKVSCLGGRGIEGQEGWRDFTKAEPKCGGESAPPGPGSLSTSHFKLRNPVFRVQKGLTPTLTCTVPRKWSKRIRARGAEVEGRKFQQVEQG